MKQSQEIKSFFYGQYFAEGLRITIGSILPVIICALLGEILLGTLISLGALLIGLSDTPGPAHHRRTGMLACLALCIVTFTLTVAVNTSFVLMCIVLAVLSFLYSMLGVFNARASTVGVMATLMMLIHIDDTYTIREEIEFLVCFLIGAVWYMIISFSFTQIQPYRLVQQELSESIRHVADFLRLKANFYNPKTDYELNYLKVIEKQVIVHEHQENVREILFKSKRSIKDTTKIGRLLTLVFNDIVDMFEQSMKTFYDYESIRKMFGEYDILPQFKQVILKVTHELDHYAYQLNANQIPKPLYDFRIDIEKLWNRVNDLDQDPDVNTRPLKKIIVNIRQMTQLINNIYNYSKVNTSTIHKEEIDDANKFIQTSHIDWKKFKDNLSLESSIFRHAVRMSLVMTAGYVIMSFSNFGTQGSFWVLLTILVILKPGFGMTKERNLQRLMGTVIGGILGGIILFTVHNEIVLFGLLICFFLIAYSLFRINYIMAVIFLTPYVLIMISFTGANTIEITKERIIDTLIGSLIAFVSSYIIFPNWESSKIKETIYKTLVANYMYLEQIAKTLINEPIHVTEYKLARKELYITSANMGSSFQRLLTEPKWRQTITKEVNRFVILNHMFSSHCSSLFAEADKAEHTHISSEQYQALRKITYHLYRNIASIQSEENELPREWMNELHPEFNELDEYNESRLITEQLQFLLKISSDLQKATDDIFKKDSLKQPKEILANA